MDALLFHPKVVHVPIALGVLMPLIAAGLALSWWRNWLPWRAWLVAVALQATLLVSGVVALRTGEAEEERVERVVAESPIEAHEEAAEVFVWGSAAVLAMMLAAAAFGRKRSGIPLAAVATLGTVVVLGLGYRTGQAGGRLVYEQGAAQVYGTFHAGGPGAAPTPREDDD
jgi:hypothetical protein